MKKIHCYISSLEGGGAERQMAYLCSFLVEAGYDVTLITLLSRPDKYEVPPSVKRVCLGYDLNNPKWLKLIKKIYVFFFFLFLRTDCIISYLIGPNAQVLQPMRLRPWTKVIVSERNFIVWEMTKREQYVYGTLYKRANYIVSNSYAMTRFFDEHYPFLKPKLLTITNYADFNKYKVYPLPLGKKLKIGIFARYDKQKNYERFAEMLSIVKNKNIRPFVVHWYGDMYSHEGKENYNHFLDLIAKYGISDVIQLYGFAYDVPSVMKSIDIICLPSVYEGFSNSLAEAICCGKPVIAGNVSDNSLMVDDGINGFLFNPTDVNDMADIFVKALMLSDDSLKEMSRQSRAMAEKLFDKKKFADEYLELIEKQP